MADAEGVPVVAATPSETELREKVDSIAKILEPLPQPSRRRVLRAVIAFYGLRIAD